MVIVIVEIVFCNLSCTQNAPTVMQSCTHRLTLQHVVTASLQTTVGVLLWLSPVMLMDPSGGAAAGVSSAAAAPSHYTALVSTTLPTLCRGKAAVSFPAAPACSTGACVPTAECAQCVPTLQHCSMTPPCSSPCPGCCEETAQCACADHALHSTAAGLYCRAPWDTDTATTVMLSSLDGVYTSQVSLGFKCPATPTKSANYFHRVSQCLYIAPHHFTVLVPLNQMKRAHHIKSSLGSTNSAEGNFLSFHLSFNSMILN